MKGSEHTYSSVNVSSYQKLWSANKFSEDIRLFFCDSFILSKVTISPVYLFARSSIMFRAHLVGQPSCCCQTQNL